MYHFESSLLAHPSTFTRAVFSCWFRRPLNEKIKYFWWQFRSKWKRSNIKVFKKSFLLDCWYFDCNLPRLNPVKTPLAYSLLAAGAIFDILQQKWRISINARFFWYLIEIIDQTSVRAKLIFYKILMRFFGSIAGSFSIPYWIWIIENKIFNRQRAMPGI